MDTIIFNFTHNVQDMDFVIEAEVTSVTGNNCSDSDWDSMDYFNVDVVMTNGIILTTSDMETLNLTDKEVERQFEAWVDTTRSEMEIDDYIM